MFAISKERGENPYLLPGTAELILFICLPKNAFSLISLATYLNTYSSSSVIKYSFLEFCTAVELFFGMILSF
jgi:hypothetical protein